MLNSAAGAGVDELSGYIPSHALVGVAPSYVSHPTDAYWGQLALALTLRDVEGVAFEGQSAPFPNIAVLPGYAPDISLFEVHQLTIYQALCHDIPGPGAPSLCSQGGGLRGDYSPTFSITIDRFVDPVPRPRPRLFALALIGISAARFRVQLLP